MQTSMVHNSKGYQGAVAGYKPPAGSAALDPEAETEAKRLLAHPDELMQLLAVRVQAGC